MTRYLKQWQNISSVISGQDGRAWKYGKVRLKLTEISKR